MGSRDVKGRSNCHRPQVGSKPDSQQGQMKGDIYPKPLMGQCQLLVIVRQTEGADEKLRYQR